MTLKRVKISEDSEADLLIKSRRRCALCFGLENDFREKKGQIAHIDKNRSNSDINNLVFLCLDHHDRYDSSTSQSKGIKKKELIKYRDDLYSYIKKWGKVNSFNDGLDYLDELIDKFSLYAISDENSTLDFPFVAKNAACNHAIFIADNIFAIDRCGSSISESIKSSYQNTGISFFVPIGSIKSTLKQRLKVKDFYINFDISNEEIHQIEFGLNDEEGDGRFYFIDRGVNLIPEKSDSIELYISDKKIVDYVLETLGSLPLNFSNHIKQLNQ
ncbi:hypothetical protein [Endozoicomonas numazuensis]|uniref:HNH nuclease domain-containing protein n=1 Tax=Endozoicomonas numazuensis TaxID=1137799 RepID=A0A081NGG4_9GAMM|nr:hypothetical protein [Endozoicomonas numazuensis]KEQ17537.1 hypothetical protein GZ78_17485 [Endozoicomonas numazuensis]